MGFKINLKILKVFVTRKVWIVFMTFCEVKIINLNVFIVFFMYLLLSHLSLTGHLFYAIYIFQILKTISIILQFLRFDWFTGSGI